MSSIQSETNSFVPLVWEDEFSGGLGFFPLDPDYSFGYPSEEPLLERSEFSVLLQQMSSSAAVTQPESESKTASSVPKKQRRVKKKGPERLSPSSSPKWLPEIQRRFLLLKKEAQGLMEAMSEGNRKGKKKRETMDPTRYKMLKERSVALRPEIIAFRKSIKSLIALDQIQSIPTDVQEILEVLSELSSGLRSRFRA